MVRRATAYGDGGEEKVGAWLAEVRARVAPRPHLRLAPARCALLVVDALRYFADPEGRCFLPAAPAAVSRTASLLRVWRAHRGTVAYVRHAHEGPEDLGMLGRFFSDHIREGEPDAAIVDALAPLPGEIVLRKTTYDGFLGTGLEEALRARAAEQVLVTGVLTHLCCETTARSAFCRGFEVYFAADATATSDERLHLGSLLALADGVAVVLSAREAADAWKT